MEMKAFVIAVGFKGSPDDERLCNMWDPFPYYGDILAVLKIHV